MKLVSGYLLGILFVCCFGFLIWGSLITFGAALYHSAPLGVALIGMLKTASAAIVGMIVTGFGMVWCYLQ